MSQINLSAKRAAVREFIGKLDQQFYTVDFVKKGDGELRTMNCRQNVQKYSNGGVNPCAGKEDLLPTYSMDSAGYRTIWIDGIKEIRGGGLKISFE